MTTNTVNIASFGVKLLDIMQQGKDAIANYGKDPLATMAALTNIATIANNTNSLLAEYKNAEPSFANSAVGQAR